MAERLYPSPRPWRRVRLTAAALLAAGLALAACEKPPDGGAASDGATNGARSRTGAEAGDGPATATDAGDRAAQPAADRGGERPVILCLGDSLTAGHGVEAAESYPAKLRRRLRAEGYPHEVVNAGVSGDTTAGGLARLDWLLRQRVDIMILELGANDGLRGQEPAQTRENLARIIERAQTRGILVILAGMKLPRNLGPDYVERFEAIYPALADEYGVPLIPFILADVAGRRALNLPDGMHPNGEGYDVVVDNVWRVLEPVLQETTASAG